jgi:peptidoglycan/LPS O-acetylase OafA/YrhL
MSDDLINTLNQIFTLAGGLARFFGSLALGTVAGWLLVQTFVEAEKRWQLQIAAILGVLGAYLCLNAYSLAGTSGGFALGIGIGALIIALRSLQSVSKKTEGKSK